MKVLGIKRFASILGALAIALFAVKALAATAVLTMTATGTIASTPVWQDGTSSTITTVAFDFGSLVAGAAAVDVDSANQTVKLVNALAYPATVAVVRPSTCSIGATSVTNAHVHFVNNGTPVTSDSNISIANNSNQTYALRFASAGNYGDDAGAVSCSSAGSLTYSY